MFAITRIEGCDYGVTKSTSDAKYYVFYYREKNNLLINKIVEGSEGILPAKEVGEWLEKPRYRGVEKEESFWDLFAYNGGVVGKEQIKQWEFVGSKGENTTIFYINTLLERKVTLKGCLEYVIKGDLTSESIKGVNGAEIVSFEDMEEKRIYGCEVRVFEDLDFLLYKEIEIRKVKRKKYGNRPFFEMLGLKVEKDFDENADLSSFEFYSLRLESDKLRQEYERKYGYMYSYGSFSQFISWKRMEDKYKYSMASICRNQILYWLQVANREYTGVEMTKDGVLKVMDEWRVFEVVVSEKLQQAYLKRKLFGVWGTICFKRD